MIVVKYKNYRIPGFLVSLQKLGQHNFKDQKAAYNAMRILKKVDQEKALAEEHFIKLAKQYATLDDKGEFLPKEGVPGTFQVPDDKLPEWEKQYKEFQELESKLERYQVKVEDLDGSALTPQDLGFLDEAGVLAPEA